MDVTVKYDTSDISAEIRDAVAQAVRDEYCELMRETISKLDTQLNAFINDLMGALEIKDQRLRDRTRKAFQAGLSKWSKELLK